MAFEEYEYETLLDRMKERASDAIDKREGSIFFDATAPAAFELSEFYAALGMVMDEVYADTASYYYLAKRAAERGVYPKEETYAVCKMEVIPTDISIAVGDRFALDTLNYTVTSVLDAEKGFYQLTCETAGIDGNQQLGDVLPIETASDINGMEKASITEILIPGENEEDVETFRERYFESFTSESFGGNKAAYKEKINNMDGIGGCKVMRAWEGGYAPSAMIPGNDIKTWFDGQSEESLGKDIYRWLQTVYHAAAEKLLTVGGTVKVYIITSEFKAPSEALVSTVQTALDPTVSAGEGDGLAPIGHVVNVRGVIEVPIRVDLAVTYKEGYSFDTLKSNIEETVDAYFHELATQWAVSDNLVIRVAQIEARVLMLEGVLDISSALLNGSEDNITLEMDEIPTRGDISG